jgi:glycosyltransferase involved in cell wall biosynthesis
MNILVLTSVYPQADDENNSGVTPVVHYFAKEWRKAGNNVLVIQNSNRYPKMLYMLPEAYLKKINSKFGIVIPNKNQCKVLFSERDGVKSIRLPMLKIMPKKRFSESRVKKQFNKITSYIDKMNLKPDVVIGHWENPQIPLISMLKNKYGCRTALVFHGIVYIKQKLYKTWVEKYIKDIDVIGARSTTIANQAKKLLNLNEAPFICYSGIADEYFNNEHRESKVQKTPNTYLYVGRLIKRKNIDVIIRALSKFYGDERFLFNIVGNGSESKNLREFTNQLGLENCIKLLGYRQRDEVIEIMNQSEVFVMISDYETFGLVYLEAMSRGCLVVASKNGGVDGIITDSYNGFLCEQGNENQLKEICKRINEMSIEEKEIMSNNAINTAYNFKDSNVAKKYLDIVLSMSTL